MRRPIDNFSKKEIFRVRIQFFNRMLNMFFPKFVLRVLDASDICTIQ